LAVIDKKNEGRPKSIKPSETEAFVPGAGAGALSGEANTPVIFKGLVTGFHEMTNIAKKVRNQLEEKAYLTTIVLLETEILRIIRPSFFSVW